MEIQLFFLLSLSLSLFRTYWCISGASPIEALAFLGQVVSSSPSLHPTLMYIWRGISVLRVEVKGTRPTAQRSCPMRRSSKLRQLSSTQLLQIILRPGFLVRCSSRCSSNWTNREVIKSIMKILWNLVNIPGNVVERVWFQRCFCCGNKFFLNKFWTAYKLKSANNQTDHCSDLTQTRFGFSRMPKTRPDSKHCDSDLSTPRSLSLKRRDSSYQNKSGNTRREWASYRQRVATLLCGTQRRSCFSCTDLNSDNWVAASMKLHKSM